MTNGGNVEGSCRRCGAWSHGVSYRWEGLCMACATIKEGKMSKPIAPTPPLNAEESDRVGQAWDMLENK